MNVSQTSNMSFQDMPESEFVLWQRLIEDRTGLWLPPNRKTFLLSKLVNRIRAKGMQSYGEYFACLIKGSEEAEWPTLVDLLTVHETRFFRDADAMKLVQNFVSELLSIEQKKRKSARSNTVRELLAKRDNVSNLIQVWSVGCSTGEEVYSIAMQLQTLANTIETPFYFNVTGTDISYPSLAIAKKGRYKRSRVQQIPRNLRSQYFTNDGSEYSRITDELKERVCFDQGNLGDLEHSPVELYNIVYCQNVLIYFQPQRKKEILDHLVKRLTTGGLLVLAPGEAMNWRHGEMTKISHPTCLAFQKGDKVTNRLRRNYGRK